MMVRGKAGTWKWIGIVAGAGLFAAAAVVAQPATKPAEKPAAPAAAQPTEKKDEKPKSAGGGDFAQPAASGKSLVVPDKFKGKGTVYYALPGKDKQIFFESTAPKETIKGQSNMVIGFAVAGPSDHLEALKGGEWHLPVDSLRTGNSGMEGHIKGGQWLDSSKNPNIVFVMDEVKDVRKATERDVKQGGPPAFVATLKGKMSLHGVTKDITIPDAMITLLGANADTAKTAKGDLMMIKANFGVMLADYGVKNAVIGAKVAEEIKIQATFYMSTVAPEQQ